jgi:hypothetical protein
VRWDNISKYFRFVVKRKPGRNETINRANRQNRGDLHPGLTLTAPHPYVRIARAAEGLRRP